VTHAVSDPLEPARWRARPEPTGGVLTRGLLDAVLNSCADGLALLDAEGSVVTANDAFRAVVGLSAAQTAGVPLADLVLPASRSSLGGAATALLVLRSAVDEHYRLACEHTPLGMAITDADGRLVQLNEPLSRLLARPATALIGRLLTDLVEPDGAPIVAGLVEQVRSGAVPRATAHTQVALPGGSARWLRWSLAASGHDVDGHLVLQADDVTAERASAERLAFLAHHDPLTGLFNRAALEPQLRTSDPAGPVAVLMIDLDGFKAVNDSLGHAAGDALLTVVADRLRDGVRTGDLVARLGGDEFVVVLLGADEATARAIAGRLVDALAAPVVVDGQQALVGASIGVALSELPGTQLDKLLRDADAALYGVKAAGKNGYGLAPPTVAALSP
jgi:diguanylate cyclase (GGDEF)-like protein/PAS domain S-box-containing protein